MLKKFAGILAITMLATAAWTQSPPPPPPPAPQTEAPQKSIKNRKVHADTPSATGSYLGVDPRDVTPDRVAALKLNEARGIEVMMVDGDSPAGKAGLKEHDVILGFNGKRVANVEQLRRMLRETPPGRAVPLSISRAGKAVTLNVTVAKHLQMAMGMPTMPQIPSDIDVPNIIVLQSSSRNGVLVEDLTPQLADFFGVRNGQGVLVRSVERGSPAASAGLKAGDVIVKIGNEPITCSSDWLRMMHEHHGSIALAVVRDKHEQNVTLKLPEKSSDSSLHNELPNLNREANQLRAAMDRLRPQIAERATCL